jgi:lactoylglutathione lyase
MKSHSRFFILENLIFCALELPSLSHCPVDELFKQVSYIMVVVSNMKKSVEFYRDILGIPLKFESEDWTEFETGATTLALHGGGKQMEKGQMKEQYAGTCEFGFTIENIQETYEKLRSKGVVFTMPPTYREGEGITLAVCSDPDGLPISIAQYARKTN